MNVLIAAASFSAQISGVQRHAFSLSRCLMGHPAVSRIDLVVAPWQQEMVRRSGLQSHDKVKVHFAGMANSSLARNLWYYRGLPKLVAELKADAVHLAYPVPINAKAFSSPTVVTLHDLYPFQIPSNFGFPKALFNQAILRQCLGQVDSIACVSESTRRLLATYAGLKVQQKALRIYNCVEPEAECAAVSPIPGWAGRPFFLCVAQHRRNKNLPFLLRAFERLLRSEQIDASTRLLIVGIEGPETAEIRRTIDRMRLSQRVLLMQGMSEADLQWCYRKCAVALAPSITEGFGLPVAEALLAGCRVVCSDIPAFREIGGAHCSYVRLDGDADRGYAEAAFSRAIVASIQLLQQRPRPVALPQLSSGVIADQYVQLYARLLAQPELHPRHLSAAHPLDSERQMQ